MRAKRIVVAAALVALLSGGAAMAADSRTAGSAGPTAKSGATEVSQNDEAGLRAVLYRGRWDQVRSTPSPPPMDPMGLFDSCSDNSFARLVAGMFGFDEFMRACEAGD